MFILYAPVSEWCDDKASSVTQVLVRVSELRVTDISETVPLFLVPAMPQLTQPRKRLCAINLLCNQFTDDVTRVHVNGADSHDLLAVALGQITQQHSDK